jgi:hypothetical protein
LSSHPPTGRGCSPWQRPIDGPAQLARKSGSLPHRVRQVRWVAALLLGRLDARPTALASPSLGAAPARPDSAGAPLPG